MEFISGHLYLYMGIKFCFTNIYLLLRYGEMCEKHYSNSLFCTFIYLFIYLYNFANEQTAHYVHKYRQLAGYTLQLAPITAALYINTIQQTIKLIKTRDFTGQITTLVTGQTYRFHVLGSSTSKTFLTASW